LDLDEETTSILKFLCQPAEAKNIEKDRWMVFNDAAKVSGDAPYYKVFFFFFFFFITLKPRIA